jgi:ABC-type glycerol-3-phosphate transport system substrate-binding protein
MQRGAAIAAAAQVAAACGSSSGSSSGGTVTLTYWTLGTQSLDSHFNAMHPGITVQGQYIASADESTAKEVAAIETGTEPDVVVGQDPSSLTLLAESGKVVNLSTALKTETDALYPGIRSGLFYNGQQLGMALGGVGDYVLFSNKKDFAKAGIRQPPATWSQLEADAIKLSHPAAHHYEIYIPRGTAAWISYDRESLLWADGGQFLNSNGTKVAFDSPDGVQALTLPGTVPGSAARRATGAPEDPGGAGRVAAVLAHYAKGTSSVLFASG